MNKENKDFVYIVDDDEAVRDSLRWLLEGNGFSVKSFESAEKLLEIAKVEYRVYKLGVDFTKEQFISEFGYGSSFPRILVDDKLLGGCLDTFKYLDEKNLV